MLCYFLVNYSMLHFSFADDCGFSIDKVNEIVSSFLSMPSINISIFPG